MSKNLKLRILSAVILGPLFLGIVYLGGWPLLIATAFCSVICMKEWFNLSKQTSDFVLLSAIGFLYIMAVFVAANYISYISSIGLLITFIAIFASDVGGYMFGKLIGGKRIYPKISPNKTWAGLAGAIIVPYVIISIGVSMFMIGDFSGYLKLLILMILLGVFAQLSDFVISALKRKAGAKDTGSIIPGHGGLLDRADSIMIPLITLALLMLAGQYY